MAISVAMAARAITAPDCVQVVIALIVTPEGLPLTYEVLPGNTADCTTLPEFLERIEVRIFVAFLAYCVRVMFKQHLKAHAPGLTVRQALDKLQAMRVLDVHFPTSDGRELISTCHTEPESDQQLLLAMLGWTLPWTAAGTSSTPRTSVTTARARPSSAAGSRRGVVTIARCCCSAAVVYMSQKYAGGDP